MSNPKFASISGNSSSSGKFSNRNLNSQLKTQSNSYGNKGNYVVMQGNRMKNGRISSTAVVAPLPMNTPSLKKEGKSSIIASTTTQNSHSPPVWGHSPSASDLSKNEEPQVSSSMLPSNANSKLAPWAKSNDVGQPHDQSKPRLPASSRNWDEFDSDEDDDKNDDAPNSSRVESNGIIINRDEVVESHSFSTLHSTNWKPRESQGSSYRPYSSVRNDEVFSQTRNYDRTSDYRGGDARKYGNDSNGYSQNRSYGNHYDNRNYYGDNSQAPPNRQYQSHRVSMPGNLRSNLDFKDSTQRDDGRLFVGSMQTTNDLIDPEQKKQLDILEEARLERELLEKQKAQQRLISEAEDPVLEPPHYSDSSHSHEQAYDDQYGYTNRSNDGYSNHRTGSHVYHRVDYPNYHSSNRYPHANSRETFFDPRQNSNSSSDAPSWRGGNRETISQDRRKNESEYDYASSNPYQQSTTSQQSVQDVPKAYRPLPTSVLSRGHSIDQAHHESKVPSRSPHNGDPPALETPGMNDSHLQQSYTNTVNPPVLSVPRNILSKSTDDTKNKQITTQGPATSVNAIDPNKTFASLFPRSPMDNSEAVLEETSKPADVHITKSLLSNHDNDDDNRSDSNADDDIDYPVNEISRNRGSYQDINQKKLLFDYKTNKFVSAETDTSNVAASKPPGGLGATRNGNRSTRGRNSYQIVDRNDESNSKQTEPKNKEPEPGSNDVHDGKDRTIWRRSAAQYANKEKVEQLNENVSNSIVTNSPNNTATTISTINNKSEERMKLKEERQKEKLLRGPRTNGLLYRFNEQGDIERILSEEEKKVLDLSTKIYSNSSYQTTSVSHSETSTKFLSQSNASSNRNWRSYRSEGVSEVSIPLVENNYEKKSSKFIGYQEKTEHDDILSTLVSSASISITTSEVPVDYHSSDGFDLDIQKIAADADANRALRGFKTFLPGVGLKQDDSLVPNSSANIVTSASITIADMNPVANTVHNDSYGADEVIHIENFLRSVDIDDTEMNPPYTSDVSTHSSHQSYLSPNRGYGTPSPYLNTSILPEDALSHPVEYKPSSSYLHENSIQAIQDNFYSVSEKMKENVKDVTSSPKKYKEDNEFRGNRSERGRGGRGKGRERNKPTNGPPIKFTKSINSDESVNPTNSTGTVIDTPKTIDVKDAEKTRIENENIIETTESQTVRQDRIQSTSNRGRGFGGRFRSRVFRPPQNSDPSSKGSSIVTSVPMNENDEKVSIDRSIVNNDEKISVQENISKRGGRMSGRGRSSGRGRIRGPPKHLESATVSTESAT